MSIRTSSNGQASSLTRLSFPRRNSRSDLVSELGSPLHSLAPWLHALGAHSITYASCAGPPSLETALGWQQLSCGVLSTTFGPHGKRGKGTNSMLKNQWPLQVTRQLVSLSCLFPRLPRTNDWHFLPTGQHLQVTKVSSADHAGQ